MDCFTILWVCASFLRHFFFCQFVKWQDVKTTYVAESSSWHQNIYSFRAITSLARENIPTTWAKYEQELVIKETSSVIQRPLLKPCCSTLNCLLLDSFTPVLWAFKFKYFEFQLIMQISSIPMHKEIEWQVIFSGRWMHGKPFTTKYNPHLMQLKCWCKRCITMFEHQCNECFFPFNNQNMSFKPKKIIQHKHFDTARASTKH